MNLLFVLSRINEVSIGGSLYTTKSVINLMAKNGHNCYFICVSKTNTIPQLFDDLDLKITKINLQYSLFNTNSTRKQILRICKENAIDIIHCFESIVYFYFRSSKFSNFKVVVTQCNILGSMGKNYLPLFNNLTLITKAVEDEYNKKPRFKNTTITYIPNRVEKFNSDNQRIQILKQKLNSKKTDSIFLAIGRITDYYVNDYFSKAINLTNAIEGSQLIIIGSSNDKQAFHSLIKLTNSNPNIHVFTDSLFTREAKELIDVCDVYIGVGRGVMEACSLGKLTLVVSESNFYPVILNQETYNELSYNNFTNCITSINNEDALKQIQNIIRNKDYDTNFYKTLFKDQFFIDIAYPKYLKVYNEEPRRGGNTNIIDRIIHKIQIIYVYIRVNKTIF